ncbi:unnamed protein product [Alternaria burnsii]|nr:unnamed protein product [Alternaria burnsii]
MEKKQFNVKSLSPLEALLMGRVTNYGLPVLALKDRQRFVDDLVYLLDTKRKNIPFYPWKCDDKVETARIPSTLPAPAHPPSSPTSLTSLDAYGISLPHNASTDATYPADFDPSEEQNRDRIFVTMGQQDVGESFSDLEKEIFADMPWGYDHVARLKVDEYTLVKGAAEDSEEEAMSELFRHVNLLANDYRRMEKEAS